MPEGHSYALDILMVAFFVKVRWAKCLIYCSSGVRRWILAKVWRNSSWYGQLEHSLKVRYRAARTSLAAILSNFSRSVSTWCMRILVGSVILRNQLNRL